MYVSERECLSKETRNLKQERNGARESKTLVVEGNLFFRQSDGTEGEQEVYSQVKIRRIDDKTE